MNITKPHLGVRPRQDYFLEVTNFDIEAFGKLLMYQLSIRIHKGPISVIEMCYKQLFSHCRYKHPLDSSKIKKVLSKL